MSPLSVGLETGKERYSVGGNVIIDKMRKICLENCKSCPPKRDNTLSQMFSDS